MGWESGFLCAGYFNDKNHMEPSRISFSISHHGMPFPTYPKEPHEWISLFSDSSIIIFQNMSIDIKFSYFFQENDQEKETPMEEGGGKDGEEKDGEDKDADKGMYRLIDR